MMMVLKYVQALTNLTFKNDEHRVKPEQIGIVTPYIRQVTNFFKYLVHLLVVENFVNSKIK